jgi:hypothetical protein
MSAWKPKKIFRSINSDNNGTGNWKIWSIIVVLAFVFGFFVLPLFVSLASTQTSPATEIYHDLPADFYKPLNTIHNEMGTQLGYIDEHGQVHLIQDLNIFVKNKNPISIDNLYLYFGEEVFNLKLFPHRSLKQFVISLVETGELSLKDNKYSITQKGKRNLEHLRTRMKNGDNDARSNY